MERLRIAALAAISLKCTWNYLFAPLPLRPVIRLLLLDFLRFTIAAAPSTFLHPFLA